MEIKGWWGTPVQQLPSLELWAQLQLEGEWRLPGRSSDKDIPSCWWRHRVGAKRCEEDGAATVLGFLPPGDQQSEHCNWCSCQGHPCQAQSRGHREVGADGVTGPNASHLSSTSMLNHKSWPPWSWRTFSCESLFFSSIHFLKSLAQISV